MVIKNFIPENCPDVVLVKGYYDNECEYRPALLMRLKGIQVR